MLDDTRTGLFPFEKIRARAVRVAILPCLALVAGCVAAPTDRRFPEREAVRLWHPWTADGAAIVQRIADRFNASQSRYEAMPLSVPGTEEAKTKFMLAVSGGDPPDLLATWEPVLPLYARDGVVQPMEGLMSPADRAAYDREYAVARRAGEYRNHVYGVAVGLNVPGVFYRPALLRAAGLPDRPPRTLEEMADWGARLDRRDAKGDLKRWGLDPGYLRDLAPLFGDLADGAGRVDTPANVAALGWIVAGRRRAGFKAVQRFQLGIGIDVASKSAEASWPFMSGRYGMAVEGQWRVDEAAKAAPEFAREYRTAPLPPRAAGPEGTGFATATLLTIPSGARHRAGAWAFVRFWGGLADPKVAAEMNVLGGWLP